MHKAATFDKRDIDEETILDADLEKKINDEGWNWVPFPGVTALKTFSTKNGYDDERGGGCGKLNLPVSDFVWEESYDHDVTIQNIVDAVYRLKGSKYDYWYELFGCISGIKIENKTLYFETDFGYGS